MAEKYRYVFGPVPSRRLGMSLGIDLVPKKVCSLDCVYCEVGKTTKLTLERMEYIRYDRVISELEQCLSGNPRIDFITFSGSGEPTLNSRIGDVLTWIKTHYPGFKTAILTNGTLLSDPGVRESIIAADVILPSLDAASQEVFERINRSTAELDVAACIQGLMDLWKEFTGEVWLEVLFLKGFNDSRDELDLLKTAIKSIDPDRVQLNTLDRPGVVADLIPLSVQNLQDIREYWNMPNVEIIAPPQDRSAIESYDGDVESAILETIARRPCTLEDLHAFLGIHTNEINKYLGTLEAKGQITSVTLDRGVFFTAT